MSSGRPVVRSSGRPIRTGRLDDLDAILALESASFADEDRFPRASWRRLLASQSALVLVITGRPDDRTAGRPDVVANIAWLLRSTSSLARMYSLAVHPDARGRGLARLLIAASLRRLPRRVDTLGLEVRSDNEAAIGLYCALGFIETARLPGYYGPGRPGLRLRATRTQVSQALTRTT